MRSTFVPPHLPSITETAATVQRHAESVRSAIRWAWSRTTRRQHNPYVSQLARNAFGGRSKCIEQTVALVVDLAQRGSLEAAEAIGLHLAAIARAEYPASDPVLSFAEAKIAEAVCEGECNATEDRMLLEPSLSNRLAYLAAASRHAEARRVLDRAVRLQTVTA